MSDIKPLTNVSKEEIWQGISLLIPALVRQRYGSHEVIVLCRDQA